MENPAMGRALFLGIVGALYLAVKFRDKFKKVETKDLSQAPSPYFMIQAKTSRRLNKLNCPLNANKRLNLEKSLKSTYADIVLKKMEEKESESTSEQSRY